MLEATGRHPRTAELNLEAVGVQTTAIKGAQGYVQVRYYSYCRLWLVVNSTVL